MYTEVNFIGHFRFIPFQNQPLNSTLESGLRCGGLPTHWSLTPGSTEASSPSNPHRLRMPSWSRIWSGRFPDGETTIWACSAGVVAGVSDPVPHGQRIGLKGVVVNAGVFPDERCYALLSHRHRRIAVKSIAIHKT